MRAVIVALCALATVARADAPALGDATGTASPIPVVRREAPGSGALDVRVAFRVGSAHDPRGQEGITALTARLMAAGATARRTWPEILAALYPLGAAVQVDVGAEQVVFSGRCRPAQAETFIAALAELLTVPALAASDLRRVRAETRTELIDGLRASDDEALSRAVLDLALHEGHPYGHLPSGHVRFLDAVTAADVRAWRSRAFVREAAEVAIGGERADEAEALIRAALDDLPRGEAPAVTIPPLPAVPDTRAVLIERDTATTTMALGFPLDVGRNHPDFLPLLLATSWLGEHRQLHGRLFRRMRGARGLNYGDYAYLEHFEQDGHSIRPRPNVARSRQAFTVWIRPVAHSQRTFALKLAVWELRRLVERGIDPAELDAARAFLLGYGHILEETVMRRLGNALDDRFYGVEHLPRLRESLPKVTKEQVDDAVRRHLRGDRLVIVAVTRDANALARELLDPAPTPITYDSPKAPELLREDEEVGAVDLGLSVETTRIMAAEDLFEGAGLPRGERPRAVGERP